MDVAIGADLGAWQRLQTDAVLNETIAPNVTLLGVADGFGFVGRDAPPAQVALATLRDYLRRRSRRGAFGSRYATPAHLRALLLSALDHVNARLFAQSGSHEDYVGSGTSLTAVLIVGHHALVGHVGDARAYLRRIGRIEALTIDDGVFADDTTGSVNTYAPAKPLTHGLLWRSLGTQAKLEASIAHVELLAGDQIVLCTDGIHRYVETDEIGDTIESAETVGDAALRLVALAKMRGALDNATVIVGRELLIAAMPADSEAYRHDRLRGAIALGLLAVFVLSFVLYVYRVGFLTH